MATTLTGTGVTFSDASTVSSTSTFDSIGSVAMLWNFSRTKYIAGATASGANLGKITAFATNGASTLIGSSILRTGNVTVPGSAANTGTPTTAAVSGTWRCMGFAGTSNFDACANTTTAYANMWVRVS